MLKRRQAIVHGHIACHLWCIHHIPRESLQSWSCPPSGEKWATSLEKNGKGAGLWLLFFYNSMAYTASWIGKALRNLCATAAVLCGSTGQSQQSHWKESSVNEGAEGSQGQILYIRTYVVQNHTFSWISSWFKILENYVKQHTIVCCTKPWTIVWCLFVIVI